MSVLQFITTLVASLAWPAVAVGALIAFRTPVRRLIEERTLQRLKAGPVEIEWEKLDKVEQQAVSMKEVKSANKSEVSTLGDPYLQKVLTLASGAPTAAIMQMSKEVESALFKLLRAHDIELKHGWMSEAIDTAKEQGLLSGTEATMLHHLRQIRKQVIRAPREVTPARAAQYVLVGKDALDRLDSALRTSP
ncbi:hypothetical protein [Saccharopolyspora rosea]|uniref:hypothetical protein n=1 Tax=Saccharopolyspora rosea TaxID=524884 RepID=UPI0021D9D60F|nr:hypothetical protein [Saccharopolyspora rosea]